MCNFCNIGTEVNQDCVGKAILRKDIKFGMDVLHYHTAVAIGNNADTSPVLLTTIWAGTSGHDIMVKETKIKYCPMCGRKLPKFERD